LFGSCNQQLCLFYLRKMKAPGCGFCGTGCEKKVER
jgi:hypothetical protein